MDEEAPIVDQNRLKAVEVGHVLVRFLPQLKDTEELSKGEVSDLVRQRLLDASCAPTPVHIGESAQL